MTDCPALATRHFDSEWLEISPGFVGRPETGLEEINGNLLEADFWPASLRACPRA